MNTERYKFIWETLATGALAAVAAVGPLLFPNVSRLLLLILFWGGLGVITIATAVRYLLLSKKEARPSEVNTATSVERKTPTRKRDLLWFFILQAALGGYIFYSFSTAPEYEMGPSNQEIKAVKEELSNLKARTMVLECADVDTAADADIRCIRFLNTFHYMFIDWPHSMDDPEAGTMLPFKHAKGVKGLELSPNDETTRAIKKAIEENTKLTVKLVGRPYRGNTSRPIVLIIGSPPWPGEKG